MDYKNNRFTVNKKLRFKNPYKNIVMIFDPKKQFKIESTKETEDQDEIDYKIIYTKFIDKSKNVLILKFNLVNKSDSETASSDSKYELNRFKENIFDAYFKKSKIDFNKLFNCKIEKNSLICEYNGQQKIISSIPMTSSVGSKISSIDLLNYLNTLK